MRRALAPYLAQPALAYGAFAALMFIVIVWWSPTPATRNPVTALLLVALLALGFEALRRRTRGEFPGAVVTQAQPVEGEVPNGGGAHPRPGSPSAAEAHPAAGVAGSRTGTGTTDA